MPDAGFAEMAAETRQDAELSRRVTKKPVPVLLLHLSLSFTAMDRKRLPTRSAKKVRQPELFPAAQAAVSL